MREADFLGAGRPRRLRRAVLVRSFIYLATAAFLDAVAATALPVRITWLAALWIFLTRLFDAG